MSLARVAERRLERQRLGAVVERGGGAVRVDVHDVLGRQAGVGERDADRLRGARAVLVGRGQVVGVRGRAVAAHVGEDVGAARARLLGVLEDRARRRPRPSRSRRGGRRTGARCRGPTSRRARRTRPARAARARPPSRRRRRRRRRRTRSARRPRRSRARRPRRPRAARTTGRAACGAWPRRRRRRCPSSAGSRAARPSSAPCSSSTWWLCVSVPMPPMPVPMMQPIRRSS